MGGQARGGVSPSTWRFGSGMQRSKKRRARIQGTPSNSGPGGWDTPLLHSGAAWVIIFRPCGIAILCTIWAKKNPKSSNLGGEAPYGKFYLWGGGVPGTTQGRLDTGGGVGIRSRKGGRTPPSNHHTLRKPNPALNCCHSAHQSTWGEGGALD